jgi:hypothetical protein
LVCTRLLIAIFFVCTRLLLVLYLLGLVLLVVLEAELVGPGGVGAVDDPLVQEGQEDEVVSQRHDLVLERHLDSESEDVVNEGVEYLEEEGLEREVCHGLQAVVDVYLRGERQEAEEVDEIHQRAHHPAVPDRDSDDSHVTSHHIHNTCYCDLVLMIVMTVMVIVTRISRRSSNRSVTSDNICLQLHLNPPACLPTYQLLYL